MHAGKFAEQPGHPGQFRRPEGGPGQDVAQKEAHTLGPLLHQIAQSSQVADNSLCRGIQPRSGDGVFCGVGALCHRRYHGPPLVAVRTVRGACQLVRDDPDGMGKVHGGAVSGGGNLHRHMAVQKLLVGEPGGLVAEDHGDGDREACAAGLCRAGLPKMPRELPGSVGGSLAPLPQPPGQGNVQGVGRQGFADVVELRGPLQNVLGVYGPSASFLPVEVAGSHQNQPPDAEVLDDPADGTDVPRLFGTGQNDVQGIECIHEAYDTRRAPSMVEWGPMTRPRTRSYDIVLFGATGFAGTLVARYLYPHCLHRGLRLALAGRSAARLGVLAEELAGGTGGPAPECIVADARDPRALRALAEKTALVCAAAGPFAQLGTALVAACARTGTDYADLTGEVDWIRRMIDRYDEPARRSGARIVHAAGFDSVPSDIGVRVLQEEVRRRTGRYALRVRLRVGPMRAGFSRGTLVSMVRLVRRAAASRGVRRVLSDPHSLQVSRRATTGPPGSRRAGRPVGGFDGVLGGWVFPFFMNAVNAGVVHRSHELAGLPYGSSFDYRELIFLGPGVSGELRLFALRLGLVFLPLVLPLALAFLLPKPRGGPRVAVEGRGSFAVDLVAAIGRRRIRLRESGDRDPGYGTTAVLFGEAALDMLGTKTVRGGVLTPAVVLSSEYPARLQAAGIRFELS